MPNKDLVITVDSWLKAFIQVLSIPEIKKVTQSPTPTKQETLSEFIIELMPILSKMTPEEFISYWESEASEKDNWRLEQINYYSAKMSVPQSIILADFLLVKHKRTRLPSLWPRVCKELAPIYCYNGIATPDECLC
tara:strand:- start:1317 stop:1724 length:408 start_codon:yes stop_codon:yes gene_type:complete